MKKLLLVTAVSAFVLGGCVAASPYVGSGLIGGYVKGPITATSNVGVTKSGKSCAYNLFSLFAWGNNSITAAKANGGITKVAQVDYDQIGVIGGILFNRTCTIAKGE